MTIRALTRNTQTKRETGREEQDNKGRRTRHDKKTRQTRRDKKKCQKLSVRIIPAAEQKKVYIFVYLHQNVIQRYTPIKITGKKPINIILTFFHYYGCLILKF